MPARHWNIGICGTFDVANYGDLLFPLIAEVELSDRLGSVTLHRFSYAGKQPPSWPYEVTSLASLPDVIGSLDGLLIGGGFLVRFDKAVAPGYDPPLPSIHHPTGYWLTPALIALQHGVPVVWNAPGMHCNDIPAWATPLLKAALSHSAYIAVRDEPTRAALQPYSARPVAAVPDTAFRLNRLLDLDAPPSSAFTGISRACGLDRPYFVLQAALGSGPFVRFLRANAGLLDSFQILVLPVSPVLGESCGVIGSVPGSVCLDSWPHPLVLAELIGRAEAVLGHSYHLCITALTSGVPVFTRQDLSTGKYTALENFDSIHQWPDSGGPSAEWFLDRIGRRPAQSGPAAARVEHHWDCIAEAISRGSASSATAMDRFWQWLPSLLEESASREQAAMDAVRRERADAAERVSAALQTVADTQARLDLASGERDARAHECVQFRTDLTFLGHRLQDAEHENAALNSRITELVNSVSWRMTAPARLLGRRLSKPEGNHR